MACAGSSSEGLCSRKTIPGAPTHPQATPEPPPPGLTRDRLLTHAEVLSLLRVSRPTLWRWRSTGAFPAGFALSGRKCLRWYAGAVLDWLEARTGKQGQGTVPPEAGR